MEQQPLNVVQPQPPPAPASPAHAGAVPPPHYVPQVQLQQRLLALSQRCRRQTENSGLYLILPGMAVGSVAASFIGIVPIVGVLMGVPALAGGGILGYVVGRQLMLARFERAQRSAANVLRHTDLPLLIADEEYCRTILSTVREQGRFLFTGPPSIARLEDQLEFAAAYFQVLQIFRHSVDNSAMPVLRAGGGRYQSVSPAARSGYVIASIASCCLGVIAIPLLLVMLWRAAEQRGTLAAISDYFAGRYE